MEVYTFLRHPWLLSLLGDDEERADGENGQAGGVDEGLGVHVDSIQNTLAGKADYELTITAFNPEQQNQTSHLVPCRVTDGLRYCSH